MEFWSALVQLMVSVLKFLCQLTGNYGIAIIILTVLFKILVYPLTHKQFQAMKDMQKLQPYMKELQEKYKKKPQELQKRMMELYKQHGVNPLGGCLPLLIQMPILILLYQTIIFFKEEYALKSLLWLSCGENQVLLFTDSSFLWIPTLFAPDMPLLILYAISMYISQKLTAVPTADPAQQQSQQMMSIMMPLLFTLLFKNFPSAFILYWLVFNILSTVQQYTILGKPLFKGKIKPNLPSKDEDKRTKKLEVEGEKKK